MADGRANLSSRAILVLSLILITHLLILSARDAQYYKFGYRYSRLHLEETSTTIEPVKVFILLPSFSTVPNKGQEERSWLVVFLTMCQEYAHSN